MHKGLYNLLICLCVLGGLLVCTSGCEKESREVGGVARLNLSTYKLDFSDNSKSDMSFTLVSTRDWEAFCAEPWVAISQTEGKASVETVEMRVYVTRNDGMNREASIYFTNRRITKVMTIVQQGTGI